MPDAAQPWADLTAAALGIQYLALLAGRAGSLYLTGLAFYFLERVRPAEPEARFFKKDFKTELCYPIVNVMVSTPVFTLLMAVATVYLLEPFVPHYVFASRIVTLPFVAQVVVALLVTDLATYAEHRFLAHGWLWDYHALHHMTPEVSWLTTLRVHPVNAITIALTAAVMRYVLGFSGEAVVVAAYIAGALALWEHANLDFGLPKPLCYLLVSPRFHRWHHATEQAAQDKNFCLIFPFLDVLGGTYYCPDRLPARYGLYRDDRAAAQPGIPNDFLGQLRYPFERSLHGVRGLVRIGSERPAS
jgi:sterol desaturase/sphingolipid hydroxylase (fatty acid hydroxylase superfamily)